MGRARAAAFGWQPRHSPETAWADYAAWLVAHPRAMEA
jgi:hypothetical protein